MTMIDLGKIKFKWKGAYDPSLTYEADDVVFYDNSSYIALANIEENQVPPNEGWDLMAKGAEEEEAKPFLRMGSYGGWVGQDIYPTNTYNKLQIFENITENTGGFSFNGNAEVIMPYDGIYKLNCSAYPASCDYSHTRFLLNDAYNIQGATGYSLEEGNTHRHTLIWDDTVRLKAGDRLAFIFYQRNLTATANAVYHDHSYGSITYLGV